MEGRGGGEILWEGSQSNYRQRCSPGFFGGTKFTFQRSLPPSPNTFFLLLSLLLPATLLFSRYCSHSHSLTVHPLCTTPLLFPHLSVSPGRMKGMEVWNCITSKASNLVPPYSFVMFGTLASYHVSQNSVGAYQPSAEELKPKLIRSPYSSAFPVTPEGMNG